MAATNDITGDSIQTRIQNENYSKNYDTIFGNSRKLEELKTSSGKTLSKCSKRCWLEVKDDEFSCIKPGCEALK